MSDPITDQIKADSTDGLFTRRQYLTRKVIDAGANVWVAMEAVASTAIEHPEWDMDKQRTWDEWEATDE